MAPLMSLMLHKGLGAQATAQALPELHGTARLKENKERLKEEISLLLKGLGPKISCVSL